MSKDNIYFIHIKSFPQDNSNISIAKITREKMLKRQQEIMKEAEERRINKERDQKLLEQKLQDEKESQEAVCTCTPPAEDLSHQLDVQVSEFQDLGNPEQPGDEKETLPKPDTPPELNVPTKASPVVVVQPSKRLESARSKGMGCMFW